MAASEICAFPFPHIFQSKQRIVYDAAMLRYHGYSVQLAVESFGRGAYFAAYELCKLYFSKEIGDVLLPLHYRVASGACAGLVGW
jgi:hypothetical protein